MNRNFAKRIGAVISAILFISSVSFSQIDDVDFLRSGAADGVKILQAYMAPWANAFGAGLNGSWYNTAKPHKLGGFDITFGINVGMVPESDGTFNVSDLGLTTLNGSGTSSTVSGPEDVGPLLTKTVSGVQLAAFNLPQGTAWRFIPVPTGQVGIGLPMGSELKVRYIPKIAIKDGDISLWGVGLMHSIMQYIPGNKMLPVDVSLFGGYTKMSAHYPVSLQPGTPQNYSTYTTASFTDQRMAAAISALNIGVIASVGIPVLTVYGGLGYSKTQTQIDLEGNYPTPVLVTTPVPAAEYNDSGVLSGSELPSIDIKSLSGLRANIGIRFKFAVITIHGDYTRALYNVFSAGLGISFR